MTLYKSLSNTPSWINNLCCWLSNL
jgi:hypothetical protein